MDLYQVSMPLHSEPNFSWDKPRIMMNTKEMVVPIENINEKNE